MKQRAYQSFDPEPLIFSLPLLAEKAFSLVLPKLPEL